MQDIRKSVSLAPLTTFGIGGPAQYFVDVRSESEVREAIEWTRKEGMPFVVLAGGSNVLVPDDGIIGLVIRVRGDLYEFGEGFVDAWAGTNLFALIQAMSRLGWGGWEKLAGIPGSVGGAVRGNAGAFGPEIKDFIQNVIALNTRTGETKEMSNDECDFSYRHSFFKDNPEWLVLRARLQLQKVAPEESARRVEETIAEREKRHLQNVCAAGSFFMNPTAPAHIVEMFEKEKQVKSREGRVPAGWLIEKAGMKGAMVGDAIASLQHPNYIVNQGNAMAADVRALAEKVRAAVREQFGVVLQEEAALL
jgi:UDP-N-acetylmuramate dehydrogenase